jgi:virulence-associated protein VapD
MYAIAFDLEIAELKKHYGEPYNNAYFEIGKELKSVGFEWTQGSVYLSMDDKSNLTSVYKAINILSNIQWFKLSVRDIRAFKVEDWSDFTEIVKG